VNNPRIIKAAQKNSAKTINAKEVVDPIPKGSENREALSAKWINLSNPWFTSISMPAPTLSTNVANVKDESEVLVLNNLFIRIFLDAQCYRTNF
jgi:hypothetical protein